MLKLRSLAPALACWLTVSSASAASFDDIQFWVGSGTNQAGLVLDWNDGKSAESLMWGYRWDGSAQGIDMFHAIVSADPRLFANVSPSGEFGVSVYGIGYDLDGDNVFDVSPPLSFDSGGWSVGSPDDTRGPTDSADHWQEGWFAGFWGYNLRSSSSDPWTGAFFGPSDRALSDGAWDGYSFAPNFNFTDPSEPVPAAVPEPTTFGLCFVAGLVLIGRRIQKRRADVGLI